MTFKFGTKKYFDELYKKNSEPWEFTLRMSQNYRFSLCIDLIKKYNLRVANILDIGCSLGQFTYQLIPLSSNIIGIDISKEAILKAKKKYSKYKNPKFKIGSLPNLSYSNNKFNLVICLEVLYYLDKYERIKALNEINRILKKQGFFLISVVLNKEPYFSINEIKSLLNSKFEILESKYLYSNIYYPIESFLLRILLIQERLLKKSRFMYLFYPLFFLNDLLIKLYLMWKFPIKLNNFMGNKFLSKDKANQVIIFARSK